MIRLLEGGAYLLNGVEIIEDCHEAATAITAKTGKSITKHDAAKNTIAYGILQAHNTSGNMQKLKIKFDKKIILYSYLISHFYFVQLSFLTSFFFCNCQTPGYGNSYLYPLRRNNKNYKGESRI